MPRQGTAERRRAREGGAPVKPGRVGWVHGTKLFFFRPYREDFLAAMELKETGAFYEKMAHLYIGTYGWNTDWADDLPEGQTQASDIDPDEDVDLLLPEVAEARAAYFTKLKGKIGVWYKAEYGGSGQKNNKPVTFNKLFDARALEPPEPEKPRVVNFYSRRFYDERVSARVNARWAVVSRQSDPPKFITVVNAVTREVWRSETPEFRAEVEAALEVEHKAAMDAYSIAISGATPTTPEEFNIALNNAAYYLQPFADGIYERFGMNVSLLLCGPVADRGGRIEVRSIHAGSSKGVLPRIWSDFDRAGFDAAQRSFIEFSHHCFTEEQCRERALSGVDMAGDASPGHVLSAAPRDDMRASPSSDEQPDVHDPNDEIPPLTPPLTTNDRAPASSTASNADGASDEDDDNDGDARPPPIIGKALAKKIAAMPASERKSYLRRLGRMHPDLVERECNMARNNLMLKRLAKGMSGDSVMLLGSDDEEDEDAGDEDAGEKRGGEEEMDEGEKEVVVKKKRPSRQKQTPSTGPARQTRARAAAAAAPGDDVTAPVAPQPPRPRPTPMWKGAPHGPVPPGASGAVEHPLLQSMGGTALDGINGGGGAGTPAEEDTSALGADGGAVETPENNESGEGEGGGEGEKVAMWEKEQREGWSAELGKGFTAFARGKKWGGGEWESCVRLFIAVEKAWGFPGKGLLSAPDDKNKRPAEVPAFMRGKRDWDATVEISGALGPRDSDGSYSSRWWSWWSAAQPPARIEANVWKAPADVDSAEWKGIAAMHGRNGMLLYLGALLWWGEAAVVDENESATCLDEWREAVEDLSAVLKEALKVVGPMRIATNLQRAEKQTVATRTTRSKTTAAAPAAPETAKSRLRKRDTPDTSAEKENDRPTKRLRARR